MKDSRNAECAIALSMLKGIDREIVKHFPECGLSLEDFFKIDDYELKRILNLNSTEGASQNERNRALEYAKNELAKISKHNIRPLFLLDNDYPVRLFEIPDPPVVLYKLGDADLDSSHIISIVGTRRSTAYGLDFCKKLVEDCAVYLEDVTIVSGLAYGIDACAHKASISENRPTVAVVAHGLNMIYPSQHRGLAQEIIRKGGAIVSEYPFDTKPYKPRFLERNRLIAALADVTIVVESDIKGGAMSTANTAFSYSREVMALPGRITDTTSAGCNYLIRKEKARIITGAPDLMEVMGWQPDNISIDTSQRNLFPELDGKSKVIYELLRYNNSEPMQLDRIHQLSLIPIAELMTLLSELEFDGVIIRHPGNRFSAS